MGESMNDYNSKLQDMRHLKWAETKNSPGTPGSFLKAYEERDGKRVYYKLSNYDSYRGIFGHENINELIVSRFLDILKVQHLSYRLIHALVEVDDKEYETYIVCSENFRKQGENKLVFDAFYYLHRNKGEAPLEFVERMGWSKYFYEMMAVDYIICNRDRHGANIEILMDSASSETHPAPLFDHGVSLLFSCYGDVKQAKEFDVMKDVSVNSFFGSKSLEYNLTLIPKGNLCFEGKLQEGDRNIIFEGLDGILPEEYFAKIWEMIWSKWKYYVQVCNQK